MRIKALALLAVFAALFCAESTAFAQMGVPAVGGTGGAGQARPRRRLHRNSSPALSPALNLVPGVSTSFGGQFLLRQVPQEQFLKSNAQTTRNFEKLENQIGQQEQQIRSGMGKTGHSVSYLNYGSYYQLGGGGAGGGKRH